MSSLYYPSFTLSPNFEEEPRWGLADGREVNESTTGEMFAAWVGDTDRTFLFSYQTLTLNEVRILIQHLERASGRSRAFYFPTWQNDLEIIGESGVGALQFRVKGNFLSANLQEDRPDTLGRELFFVNKNGAVGRASVLSAVEDGEDDVIALKEPMSISIQGGQTICSFMLLCRMSSDTTELNYLAPGVASGELGMRTTRHTRRVSETQITEDPDQGNLKGNREVVARDQDLPSEKRRQTRSQGPQTYLAPQSDNFTSGWNAVLEAGKFRILGPDGRRIESALYQENSQSVSHIALTFDGSSREIIAWDRGDGDFVVSALVSGAIQKKTFSGRFPVLFNTFAIDSTIDAGNAVIACFYIKSDHDEIFMRLSVENFDIERVFTKSAFAPISLSIAERRGANIVITGMDSGHRMTEWISADYLPPTEVLRSTAKINGILGAYESPIKSLAVEDNGNSEIVSFSGAYQFVPLPEVPLSVEDNGNSEIVSFSGAYQFVPLPSVPLSVEDRGRSTMKNLSGNYRRVIITGESQFAGSAKPKGISGSYEN